MVEKLRFSNSLHSLDFKSHGRSLSTQHPKQRTITCTLKETEISSGSGAELYHKLPCGVERDIHALHPPGLDTRYYATILVTDNEKIWKNSTPSVLMLEKERKKKQGFLHAEY